MKQCYQIFSSQEELEQFLPGHGLKSIMVEGVSVCIARDKNGFYAFENKCPHYSVPLDTGNINYMGEVVCSLHAYRFSLKDGWETNGKGLCLKRFEIQIDQGVYIML